MHHVFHALLHATSALVPAKRSPPQPSRDLISYYTHGSTRQSANKRAIAGSPAARRARRTTTVEPFSSQYVTDE